MNPEDRNRLVNALLFEVVGGETAPDLTERIMARAFPSKRRVWAWAGAAAWAAALLVAVGVWLIAGEPYPDPTAEGSFTVEGGGALDRGKTIVAAEKTTLKLGGYCTVAMEPESRLEIGGEPEAEEIYLESGTATCEVDRGKGTFTVRSGAGTVVVRGTRFHITVTRKEGGEVSMHVKVLLGAVLLCALGAEDQVLAKGEERTVTGQELPKAVRGFSGQVRGVVVGAANDHDIFTFKVARILKVWKGSEASNPNKLKGMTIKVGPRWVKGDDGKWHKVEIQVHFIRKL
ncbi:MAG: FecR domain-containing protein, partial [Planctomycetota bacterium]